MGREWMVYGYIIREVRDLFLFYLGGFGVVEF